MQQNDTFVASWHHCSELTVDEAHQMGEGLARLFDEIINRVLRAPMDLAKFHQLDRVDPPLRGFEFQDTQLCPVLHLCLSA
jgi:hypothetical protein